MNDLSKLDPFELAALNTREALTAFWDHPYVTSGAYYTPEREAIYEAVLEMIRPLLDAKRAAGEFCRIVDVGCGDGHLIHAMHYRYPYPDYDLQMWGWDWAQTAIQRAQRVGWPEVYFEDRNFLADDLSLFTGQFDVVLCTEVLEHMPDPSEAVRRLCYLAKIPGAVVITVPNGDLDTWEGHPNKWAPKDLHCLLGSFGDVDLHPFANDRYQGAILRPFPF